MQFAVEHDVQLFVLDRTCQVMTSCLGASSLLQTLSGLRVGAVAGVTQRADTSGSLSWLSPSSLTADT